MTVDGRGGAADGDARGSRRAAVCTHMRWWGPGGGRQDPGPAQPASGLAPPACRSPACGVSFGCDLHEQAFHRSIWRPVGGVVGLREALAYDA